MLASRLLQLKSDKPPVGGISAVIWRSRADSSARKKQHAVPKLAAIQKNRKTEKQNNRTTEQQILAGISNRSASDPT
jgi:hypothetical protein